MTQGPDHSWARDAYVCACARMEVARYEYWRKVGSVVAQSDHPLVLRRWRELGTMDALRQLRMSHIRRGPRA